MPEKLRHLVVVVPGIGGSVLADAKNNEVWGNLSGFAQIGARPERLNLEENPSLRPVGLIPDILLFRPFLPPGYARLVKRIQEGFPGARIDVAVPEGRRDMAADVVLFPYDFRRGVVDAAERLKAEIDARLSHLPPDQRREKAVVVGHSMGGLVARYWAGPLGGHAQCACLVTLGTPHRGAPKALEYLVNGAPLGGERIKEMLRGWRSTYELLPRYRMVLPEDAEAALDHALYPHELSGYPGFGTAAKAAFDLHGEIEQEWRRLVEEGASPKVMALFSRGHATLAQGVLADGRLRVLKESPPWLPNPEWMGDGTVPAISAIPVELDAGDALPGVAYRHRGISSAKEVVEILRNLSGASLEAVTGKPSEPWLGLDMETVVPAHEPFRVGTRLWNAPTDDRTRIWARVREHRSRVWERSRFEPSGDGWWNATLPGLAEGTYELRVDAVGVPEVEQLHHNEVFGVVEP